MYNPLESSTDNKRRALKTDFEETSGMKTKELLHQVYERKPFLIIIFLHNLEYFKQS